MKKIYEQPSARPISLHFRSSVFLAVSQLHDEGGDGNTLVRRRMWDEEEEEQ